MLEKRIKEAIPDYIDQFPKLTPGHDPYRFDAWETVGGETILRYWFWNKEKTKKNKKRVFISEIRNLLKEKREGEQISRSDFERCCPRTNRDGGCGFAVIIRILEHLKMVGYMDAQYWIIYKK